MLNRRNYTIYGHDWNPMPDMEVDIWGGGGGSYFWKGGSRKGGFGGSDEPPEPPLVTGLGLLQTAHMSVWANTGVVEIVIIL